MNGISSLRYTAPRNAFSSPKNYPNRFYCQRKNYDQDKHIDGVLDVSRCIDGHPPMFISFPHFLEGDEKLFELFEGLSPNESLHRPFAHIHPRLAVPLDGASKMQLNLRVHHLGKYYEKIPQETILPLAWVEITDDKFPPNIQFLVFLSTIVADYFEVFIKYGSIIFLIIWMPFLSYYYNVVQRKASLIK